MRKIAIAAAVSLSLTGISGVSNALGLGEIEMYSALNQSLDAEIAILSATEEELRGMRVSLASEEAFARAGLEQLPVLSSVSFAVDRRPDGKPVVKVTSDGPVLEPFLNFLIEVESPGSVQLVREYTVLIDPPSFASTQAPVEATPVAAADTFSSSVGEGVRIDLTDAIVENSAADSNADDLASDLAGEVSFVETELTATVADATDVLNVADVSGAVSAPEDQKVLDGSDLFVPDNKIFANAESGSSVVGTDGQVISLTQELNTTPQFDFPTEDTSQAIPLVDDSEPLDLAGLGAEVATGNSNAIFENEFGNDPDAGAEVMTADVLATLIEPLAEDPSVPEVQFEEIQVSSSPAASSVFDNEESTVADGEEGYGDIIDLSGILAGEDQQAVTETEPFFVDVEQSSESVVTQVSGSTYRVQQQDTLWRIANQEKARGVTPHQMMVALLNANPGAFENGDMNRMKRGALLEIPTVDSQRSIDRSNALAIVQSWTRGDGASAPRIVTTTNTFTDNTPTDTTSTMTDAVIVNDTDNEISRSLEEVNRQMEVARSELASETLQRDEIQGRVNSLEDSMSRMKSLITLREDELNRAQEEVAAITVDTDSSMTAGTSELTQDQIERRADADKNLATAEAEAKSIRLSSEEDILRAQLAALQIEKRDAEASSELEKAELVRQSEREKTALLEQARAERERIMASLETEKTRISEEAASEIARIKGQADTDKQQLVADAEAERIRLSNETAQMKAQLDAMEAEKERLLAEATAEKDRLLAEAEAETMKMEAQAADAEAAKAELQVKADEQARLTAAADAERKRVTDESARVKERLAQLQQESGDGGMSDTDADGNITDTGKKLAAGGAAAVGGLLGFAPLQEMVGNRKNVLGIGAGLSLLGLLSAWGFRRNRRVKEEPVLRPRGNNRPTPAAPAVQRTNFDDRKSMHDGAAAPTAPKAAVPAPTNTTAATAAKTAAATAAVAGTAAAAATTSTAVPEAPAAPTDDAQYRNTQSPAGSDAELDEVALDDTITEAEVYLRYGLHGQAEDLLKTAIKRSPDNEEYHFKLLENYHDQKNVGAYKETLATFNQKFSNSDHTARINEMSTDLDISADDVTGNTTGNATLGGAGVAAAGAAALGAAATAKGSAADLLDQTIDPGTEFSVDELQATGNLSAMMEEPADFDVEGNMSLDDVDLASLDDDGTMNLEEVTGSQMSGLELGALDLTNPDGDNTFDNLTLDDADINSLGNATGNVRSGLEADLPVDGPATTAAGGSDEMETMLDLAKAYMDMGDTTSAEKTLKDIASRGNPMQQIEASELLKKL